MRKGIARISVTALGLAAALILSSCSSGKSSGDDSTGSGSAGSRASGTPISIGMINQENTAAGSFPEMRESLQASFSYINNDLGGVNGHPLKLTACITDATAASSANCAREMVSDKVAAGAGQRQDPLRRR